MSRTSFSRSPSVDDASGAGKGGASAVNASAFHSAACRAHDVGDLSAAVHLYTAALDLEPLRIASLVGRGVAQKEGGEYSNALNDYTRALGVAPSDAVARLVLSNRANCLAASGALSESLADHDRALSLATRASDDAVIFCNRGGTLLRLGRLADARTDFMRALEADPAYAVANYNLGLVAAREGRVEDATNELSRAAAIFRRSSRNGAHAADCEHAIAFITGSLSSEADADVPGAALHRPATAPNPTRPPIDLSIDLSPLSSVHQRGITRSFVAPSRALKSPRPVSAMPIMGLSAGAALHSVAGTAPAAEPAIARSSSLSAARPPSGASLQDPSDLRGSESTSPPLPPLYDYPLLQTEVPAERHAMLAAANANASTRGPASPRSAALLPRSPSGSGVQLSPLGPRSTSPADPTPSATNSLAAAAAATTQIPSAEPHLPVGNPARRTLPPLKTAPTGSANDASEQSQVRRPAPRVHSYHPTPVPAQ